MGWGALEAIKVALWQRLGELEHSGHVFTVVCEIVLRNAASAGEVQKFSGR